MNKTPYFTVDFAFRHNRHRWNMGSFLSHPQYINSGGNVIARSDVCAAVPSWQPCLSIKMRAGIAKGNRRLRRRSFPKHDGSALHHRKFHRNVALLRPRKRMFPADDRPSPAIDDFRLSWLSIQFFILSYWLANIRRIRERHRTSREGFQSSYHPA